MWSTYQHAVDRTLRIMPGLADELSRHGSIYKASLGPKDLARFKLGGANWVLEASLGVFTDKPHPTAPQLPDVSALLGSSNWQ